MDVTDLPPWLEITADPTPDAVVLPGAAARRRAQLFPLLATALDLPGHVGHNWDALADSLLDRVDAGPLTLRVDDADQLLADEPPAQFATLLLVGGDIWSHGRNPVRVVLRAAPDRVPELRRRALTGLSSAGRGSR